MWESPNWIGSAITAKVKLKSDRESRASQESIAEADRVARLEAARIQAEASKYGSDTQAAIAAANRAINKEIADADRASRETIAANELVARTTIADKQMGSNETIAQLNRELTASENQKQRDWQSGENQLDRANRIKVAGINAASNVASQGVRLVPLLIGKTDTTNKSGGGTKPTAKISPAVVTDEATVAKSPAQKKADDLFPNLEPTWSVPQVPNLNPLVSSSSLAGLATLVLGTAVSMVPFI